jgi:antitoxin (DNA-binding transcriptional repressor) of toxin-antitoxin stability system
VRAGECLSLTVNREPVADIVPHQATRSPWVHSETLRTIVQEAGADARLLDDLAGVRNAVIDDR